MGLKIRGGEGVINTESGLSVKERLKVHFYGGESRTFKVNASPPRQTGNRKQGILYTLRLVRDGIA